MPREKMKRRQFPRVLKEESAREGAEELEEIEHTSQMAARPEGPAVAWPVAQRSEMAK